MNGVIFSEYIILTNAQTNNEVEIINKFLLNSLKTIL